MMKILSWGVVVTASLIILLGASAYAYADEAAPPAAPDVSLVPLNRNTLEQMREKKKKAAEAQKAKEDEKLREQEKKAKVDKIERRTGLKSKSWQVQNW